MNEKCTNFQKKSMHYFIRIGPQKKSCLQKYSLTDRHGDSEVPPNFVCRGLNKFVSIIDLFIVYQWTQPVT